MKFQHGFRPLAGSALAALVLTAGAGQAEVPADIAAKLVQIGRVVDPPNTAKIYRPLHKSEPYPGVTVVRDQSFGPDPANVVDVFMPEKGGGKKRPVLIFVSGGAGNKRGPAPDQDFSSDNIALWAVKNGMTGVNVQRRPGAAWDDPAKDIGKAVEWVRANIAKYKGNPDRVFLWAQSAGTIPTATYISHPEFFGPKGVGLKGVVLMSGPPFNILPLQPPPQGPVFPPGAPGAGQPKGGEGKKGDGKKGGGPPPVDPATQLARSNLPGLLKSTVALNLISAELDPMGMAEFQAMLKDELCKAGHCPVVSVLPKHSHMSEVYSVNTADDSVTAPILKWMKSVK